MLQSTRHEVIALSLVIGVGALVVVIYAVSFAGMVDLWRSAEHHHGALVLPITLCLLWRIRDSLARIQPQPWTWGIVLLVVLVATWHLAIAVGIQAIEQLAVLTLIPAATLTFLGPEMTRRALFPLLFLLAAVPIGDVLIPYLISLTATLSEGLLRVVGVPVFREGRTMTLPGGQFEIAEVCAGLRYLIAGTDIALLYAYLTYRNGLKRICFVVLTIIILLLANGVRAFFVMYVASASDMRYLAGGDHVYFGWFLFATVIGLLLWFGGRFMDEFETTGDADNDHACKSARPKVIPLVIVFGFLMLAMTSGPIDRNTSIQWILMIIAGALSMRVLYRRIYPATRSDSQGHQFFTAYQKPSAVLAACTAVCVLAAGPALSRNLAHHLTGSYPVPELPGIRNCAHSGPWSASWQPELESPDFEISANYRCSAESVNVYVAGYWTNSQGKELINSGSQLIPDSWRAYSDQERISFEPEPGHVLAFNEVHIERPGMNSHIWFWYAVDDQLVTRNVNVKLWQLYHYITSGRADSRVYLLETSANHSLEADRNILLPIASSLIMDWDFNAGSAHHSGD